MQRETFPDDLPFRIISRTVGQGAYAFIRQACPKHASTPVIAVKFINKHHALKIGRVKPKQIQAEVALHNHVGKHEHIIEFLGTGEDDRWTWIAMELANGDLFDKVEADVGLSEDLAHFYFTQLISAVGYMHSRNVAHRDIKPENILLCDEDLKLADFGLAVLFGHNGQRKPCQTVCGSPPYMAPEIIPKDGFTGRKTEPYEGDVADIWSCGIVLFVLLVGNTPWDEPTRNSDEFNDYVRGNTTEGLWSKIPLQTRSLLRGMLRVDSKKRMSLEEVRRHPWFTRHNSHLTSDGRAANPVVLATQMLEKLHIDFTADPTVNTSSSQRPSKFQSAKDHDAMDLDTNDGTTRLALTQPETPIIETQFDWERHARVNGGISASQPVYDRRSSTPSSSQLAPGATLDLLSADPSLSQFSSTPYVPVGVTQQARRFRDIVPAQSMARFLSFMDFPLLLPLLCEALGRLGIPAPTPQVVEADRGQGRVFVPVKTRDQRKCRLAGTIAVERIEEEVLEVRFLKATGDPLEWRRLFKKVAVICKDAVLKPDEG